MGREKKSEKVKEILKRNKKWEKGGKTRKEN